MLGWHVDHDQAVDARRFGFGDKPRYAVVVNRVEVTHQHQRGVAVAFTEFANHLQGIRQILPGRQRTDIGQLNRRTIRHRVSERHAQLDHISARSRQAFEDRQRGVVIRIAGSDEGHQGSAVLFLEFSKTRLQAAH